MSLKIKTTIIPHIDNLIRNQLTPTLPDNINSKLLFLTLRCYAIQILRIDSILESDSINNPNDLKYFDDYINNHLLIAIKNFADPRAIIRSIAMIDKLQKASNEEPSDNLYKLLIDLEIITDKEILTQESDLIQLQQDLNQILDTLPTLIKSSGGEPHPWPTCKTMHF